MDEPSSATEPEPEIAKAAGVILKAPTGRVLMLHRVDGQGWSWPAGGLEPGETAEKAAFRECVEEVDYRPGDLKMLMRSVKNGVDFVTFTCACDSEFVPRLNAEHDQWGWFDPVEVLREAQGEIDPLVGDMIDASLDLLEARLARAEALLN